MLFSVNSYYGCISFNSLYGICQVNTFQFLPVYARDGGLPPNFAKALVRVEVQDVNDNAPVFAKMWYGLQVPENQEPVELCSIKATDPDSGPGGELEYKIACEKRLPLFFFPRHKLF